MRWLILLTLLAFLNQANSSSIFNSVGGITTITDKPCRYEKSKREAYSSNDQGEMEVACYWIEGDTIYFKPRLGGIRSLPLKLFKQTVV